MKVGLISSIPNLGEFATGSFHLLLSHLLTNSKYCEHYALLARQGTWLTLDNSAYEYGTATSLADTLLDQAIDIQAREIVCPDVMHNMQGTLTIAAEALYQFKDRETKMKDNKIQLMLVPHGETIYEWGQCMSKLINMHTAVFGVDQRYSIGVPKDYEEFKGGRMNLIQRFVSPQRRESIDGLGWAPDTHLLGMGEDMTALTALSMRFPWIRSTDSVKPFVYALFGIRLNMEYMQTPEYPGRPADYFTINIPEKTKPLVMHNIEVVQARAGEKVAL